MFAMLNSKTITKYINFNLAYPRKKSSRKTSIEQISPSNPQTLQTISTKQRREVRIKKIKGSLDNKF